MTNFKVYIDTKEWVRYVKDQVLNYEIADTHLADLLGKYFKTVEVETL